MANKRVRRKIKKEVKKLILLHRVTGIRLNTIAALISGAAAGIVLKNLAAGIGVYFAVQLANKLIEKEKKTEDGQNNNDS